MSTFNPDHQHKHRHRDSQDPIQDYVEWTQHRYEPGYYLGGKLTPFMRNMQKMWSPREKRVLRVFSALIFLAVMSAIVWRVLNSNH
jgi:hypothetical protein